MQIDILKTYFLNGSAYNNNNMFKLYLDLKEFVDSRFSGKIEFQPHERILFLHDDLDFFISKDYPGFTLYNLQLILRELNISNFFCAVVSNLPDYQHHTNMVGKILNPTDVPLRGISSLQNVITVYLKSDMGGTKLNINQITHPFISLSRQARFHRTFFTAKLFENNLQNTGLVSYHNIPWSTEAPKTNTDHANHLDVDFSFLQPVPFRLENTENCILKQYQNQQLVKNFQSTVTSYVNFTDNHDIRKKGASLHFQNSVTQNALVFVGLETSATYLYPFVTTISFKGIANKRPFIIFGAPGILKYLRDLGFKTFDRWWDESYDLELDVETRADMIIKIVNQLSTYSQKQLQQLCLEMEEILEYNHQYLLGPFVLQEKQKIENGLAVQFL
jgi:hypothetical protein